MNDELRLQLLRILSEHPDVSQRELAHALGLSLGKTNYCLRALIARGWVKVNNFRSSDNKRAYAYVLTASGLQDLFPHVIAVSGLEPAAKKDSPSADANGSDASSP